MSLFDITILANSIGERLCNSFGLELIDLTMTKNNRPKTSHITTCMGEWMHVFSFLLLTPFPNKVSTIIAGEIPSLDCIHAFSESFEQM